MGDVVKLVPPEVCADRRWAEEKAESLIKGLRLAVGHVADPQVLRPAVWNATKLACWLRGEEWTVAMAEELLKP